MGETVAEGCRLAPQTPVFRAQGEGLGEAAQDTGDGCPSADSDNGCFVRNGACVGNAASGLSQETHFCSRPAVDSARMLERLSSPSPRPTGPAACVGGSHRPGMAVPSGLPGMLMGLMGTGWEML